MRLTHTHHDMIWPYVCTWQNDLVAVVDISTHREMAAIYIWQDQICRASCTYAISGWLCISVIDIHGAVFVGFLFAEKSLFWPWKAHNPIYPILPIQFCSLSWTFKYKKYIIFTVIIALTSVQIWKMLERNDAVCLPKIPLHFLSTSLSAPVFEFRFGVRNAQPYFCSPLLWFMKAHSGATLLVFRSTCVEKRKGFWI